MTDSKAMLSDFLNLMDAISSGPAPKVADNVTINGFTVSTAHTHDCGWETAIWQIDKQNDGGIGAGIYVVDNYQNEQEALAGHHKWQQWAENVEFPVTILDLGYGESVPPEEITLYE